MNRTTQTGKATRKLGISCLVHSVSDKANLGLMIQIADASASFCTDSDHQCTREALVVNQNRFTATTLDVSFYEKLISVIDLDPLPMIRSGHR